MKENTTKIKRYYRQIRNWLPCSRSQKKTILNSIRNTISAYLKENQSADYVEIQQRFGTPHQIAATYVDEMETEELLRHLKIRKRITVAVTTCIALILTVWIVVATLALINFQKATDGYYDIEIEIAEEMVS